MVLLKNCLFGEKGIIYVILALGQLLIPVNPQGLDLMEGMMDGDTPREETVCKAMLVFAVGLWMWGHVGVCHGMSDVRSHWCSPWDVGCETTLMFDVRPHWCLPWDAGCESKTEFTMGCQAWNHTGVCHGTLDMRPHWCSPWDVRCKTTLMVAVRPHRCLLWGVACESKLELTVGHRAWNHTGVCRGMPDMRPHWCSPRDIGHEATLVFAVGDWMHSHAGVVCQLAAGGCSCLCSHQQLPAIPEHPPGALPGKQSVDMRYGGGHLGLLQQPRAEQGREASSSLVFFPS